MPINLKQIIQEETKKLLLEEKNVSPQLQKPELKKFVEDVHTQFEEDRETKSIGILQHKLKIHGFYDGKKFSDDEDDIQKLYDAVQKVKKFALANQEELSIERPDALKSPEYNVETHYIASYLGSSSKENLNVKSDIYPDMSLDFDATPGSDFLKSLKGYPLGQISKIPEPTKEPIKEPTKEPTKEPADQPAEEPAEKSEEEKEQERLAKVAAETAQKYSNADKEIINSIIELQQTLRAAGFDTEESLEINGAYSVTLQNLYDKFLEDPLVKEYIQTLTDQGESPFDLQEQTKRRIYDPEAGRYRMMRVDGAPIDSDYPYTNPAAIRSMDPNLPITTNLKPGIEKSMKTSTSDKDKKSTTTKSDSSAVPFTIKYSVKPDGEKYKFVATVVDKSGNKEFESFEEPLASPDAPRDAAYQKVTQKARDFMQQSAKARSAPAPIDTPVKQVKSKDDKDNKPVKQVKSKDDKDNKPVKQVKSKDDKGNKSVKQVKSKDDKPKPKTIFEQLPRGEIRLDRKGPELPISIFGKEGYTVKFYNTRPTSALGVPIKGDGVIQLRLPKSKSFPEGEVRKFSVKKLVIAHFAKIDKDKGSLKLRGEIAGQDELVEIKPLQLEAMVKQCIGPFPHNTGIGRDGDKKIRISKDPKAEPIVILRTK